jgi:hypothetical protein
LGVVEGLAGAAIVLELEPVVGAVAVIVRVVYRSLVFDTDFDLEDTHAVEELEQREAHSQMREYWSQENLAFCTSARFLEARQIEDWM